MSASYHGSDDSLVRQEAAGLATLQSLTAKLARTSSVGEVAWLVLSEGASRLGTSTGSFCLVEDGELVLAATTGYSESVINTYHTFPIDEHTPAGLVVLTRGAFYCGSIDEMIERFPTFRDRPLVDNEAFAVLPLQGVDEDILGALVIGYAEQRSFEPADRELLEALANEATAALEPRAAHEALQRREPQPKRRRNSSRFSPKQARDWPRP